MTNRISSLNSHQIAIDGIQDITYERANIVAKATSDNPYPSFHEMNAPHLFNATIAATKAKNDAKAYASNTAVAINRFEKIDSVLGEIADIAVEVRRYAMTTSLYPGELMDEVLEVQLDQLTLWLNHTDEDGNYLFAGGSVGDPAVSGLRNDNVFGLVADLKEGCINTGYYQGDFLTQPIIIGEGQILTHEINASSPGIAKLITSINLLREAEDQDTLDLAADLLIEARREIQSLRSSTEYKLGLARRQHQINSGTEFELKKIWREVDDHHQNDFVTLFNDFQTKGLQLSALSQLLSQTREMTLTKVIG